LVLYGRHHLFAGHVVLRLFEVKLHINLVRRVFQVAFVLLLNYLADAHGHPQDVVLAEEQDLVPQNGAQVDVEAVGKQRDDPLEQEHAARGVVLLEVPVDERAVFPNEAPHYFVGLQDLNLVGRVKVVQDVELVQHQVAERDEALFRPGLVDQQHRREVAHALHVLDVGPVVLERAKHVDQGLTQTVDLLEQLVQMWKRPRDIFEQQRIAFDNVRLPVGVDLLSLAESVVGLLELLEYLSVDPVSVADKCRPQLSPVAHGHVAFQDFGLQLFVGVVLAALDQRQVDLNPGVELFFGVLVLEVLKVLFCVFHFVFVFY